MLSIKFHTTSLPGFLAPWIQINIADADDAATAAISLIYAHTDSKHQQNDGGTGSGKYGLFTIVEKSTAAAYSSTEEMRDGRLFFV